LLSGQIIGGFQFLDNVVRQPGVNRKLFANWLFLSVLSEKSPFLTGSMLGLAILARPTFLLYILFCWEFIILFKKESRKFKDCSFFVWTFSSAGPNRHLGISNSCITIFCV
jgi:hypothetical protein